MNYLAGFATTALTALVVVAMATLTFIGVSSERRDHEVASTLARSLHDDIAPLAPVGPVRIGTQFTVTCPASGGTPLTLNPSAFDLDSLYVAPKAGSSVKVRAGYGSTLTASTGFEIGTSARDGVGVSLTTTKGSDPRCISEGAAQDVDVILGRE